MRKTPIILAALAALAVARSSWAFPPSSCHQSLTGLLRSARPSPFAVVGPIDLRLSVLNVEGDLELSGRYRCKPLSGNDQGCVGSGTSAVVNGYSGVSTTDGFGRQFRIALVDPRRPEYTVLCELDAVAPVVWKGCIPSMSGTYVCKQGDVETDHGIFGLAAKSCRQCW